MRVCHALNSSLWQRRCLAERWCGSCSIRGEREGRKKKTRRHQSGEKNSRFTETLSKCASKKMMLKKTCAALTAVCDTLKDINARRTQSLHFNLFNRVFFFLFFFAKNSCAQTKLEEIDNYVQFCLQVLKKRTDFF